MWNAAIHFDPTSLAKYGRLALVARGLVEGFLGGAHQSPYKGYSVEFAELRQMIKPRANAKHLLRLLQTLEQTEPGGETSLAPLWHDLAPQFKRRGMVVILSDCFEPIGPLLRALRHFRHRRHEVLLFHILA